MTPKLSKTLLPLIFFLLPCPAAFAGGKQDSARELLQNAHQQADIWTQGPVQLVSKVTIVGQGHTEVNLELTVTWLSPEKWRTEWRGPGYSQVTLLNNGRLYRYGKPPVPPLHVLQVEHALGALSDFDAAGPFSPKLYHQKRDVEVWKKKLGGINVTCVDMSWPNVCIETTTGRTVRITDQMGTYSYGNYVELANLQIPQSLDITLNDRTMSHATLAVTRNVIVGEALFTAPKDATAVDYPSCKDPGRDEVLPHIEHQVSPGLPPVTGIDRSITIWLHSSVGTDGHVDQVDVILAILAGDSDFERTAIKAVKQWKYTPYLRCGVAAPFQTVIPLGYSITSVR